ncbi:hypothetical protein TruAng_002929 [Truncatella angustata]|nr:hypothetical protein TruAng_002929 [Truncatella angustata]
MHALLTTTGACAVLASFVSGLAIGRSDQTPNTLPKGWSYHGCLVHIEEGQRSKVALVDDDEMTQEICARFCAAKDYQAAGVSNGTDCHCWSSPNLGFIKMADEVCTLPCSGDPSQMCGGKEAFTVISTLVSSQTELRSESLRKRSKCGGNPPVSLESTALSGAEPGPSVSTSADVPGSSHSTEASHEQIPTRPSAISPIFVTVQPWTPTESSDASPSENTAPFVDNTPPIPKDAHNTKASTSPSRVDSPPHEKPSSAFPAPEAGAPFSAAHTRTSSSSSTLRAVIPVAAQTSSTNLAAQFADPVPTEATTSFEPFEIVDPIPTDFASTESATGLREPPIAAGAFGAAAPESSSKTLAPLLGDPFSTSDMAASPFETDTPFLTQNSADPDAFPVIETTASSSSATVLPIAATAEAAAPTLTDLPSTVASSPTAAATGPCASMGGTFILQNAAAEGHFAQLQPAVGSGFTVPFNATQAEAQEFQIQPDCSFTTADGSLRAMIGGTPALQLYDQYFFPSTAAANAALPGAWETDYCTMNDDDTLHCSAMMQSTLQIPSATEFQWQIGVQNEGVALTINLIAVNPIAI